MMTGNWSVDETWLSLHVAFADDILAWIHDRGRWICLLYVEFGTDYCLVPPNREILNRIAVSASMVAATTNSGKCHVWKLPLASHEPDHFPIQLMSAFVQQIEVSGSSLAILHALPQCFSNKTKVEITTWTMGSQKTIHFSAKLHRRHIGFINCIENSERRIILDSTGTYVSLFEKTQSSMYHTRFDLKGQIQSQSSLDNVMSQLNEFDTSEICDSSGSQSSDGNGCSTLWSFVQLQSPEWKCCGDLSCTKLIRIRWNSGLDHLEIRSDVIHGFGSDLQYTDLFYWKNVVYFRGRKRVKTANLELLDLDESTVRSAVMDLIDTNFDPVNIDLVNTDSDGADTYKADFSNSDFLGNELFLINISSSGFIVWCFDKNVIMEKRSRPYEEEMEFRRGVTH